MKKFLKKYFIVIALPLATLIYLFATTNINSSKKANKEKKEDFVFCRDFYKGKVYNGKRLDTTNGTIKFRIPGLVDGIKHLKLQKCEKWKIVHLESLIAFQKGRLATLRVSHEESEKYAKEAINQAQKIMKANPGFNYINKGTVNRATKLLACMKGKSKKEKEECFDRSTKMYIH